MLEISSKSKGAELTSIKYNGEEKLHQGSLVLDENGNAFWGRHAPVLFPIVGQIKDGKTIINGKEYQMSQHGFARDMEFRNIEKTENMHKYVLKSDEKTLEKFPFKFELYITYVVDKNTVTTRYEIVNKDDKQMVFGLGGHPAFICDYKIGNFEIEFEKQEDNIKFLKLQDGLLSDEEFKNILTDNKIKLHKDIFCEDAIIMENIKSNKVTLVNTLENKKVLEFDFTGFPYLAIWSKVGAPFVCIEPWFNTADKVDSDGEFKNKENILKLQPNEKFECEYKVTF